MTAPRCTILHCRATDGTAFIGKRDSIFHALGIADAYTEEKNGSDIYATRWFRLCVNNGWLITDPPASWGYGHGTDPQMITNEINKADAL